MVSGTTFIWINDSQVEHSVDAQGHVVGGNSALLRHINGDFLQALHIFDFVRHRNQNVQAGVQNPMKPAHALDYPGLGNGVTDWSKPDSDNLI